MDSSLSFLHRALLFPIDTGYGDFRFTPLSHSSIAISVGSQMPHTHSKSATQHKTREPGFVPCTMSVRRLTPSFQPFRLSFSFIFHYLDNEAHRHCSSCAAFRSFKCFTYAPVGERIAAARLPGSLLCHHGSCGRCVATTRTESAGTDRGDVEPVSSCLGRFPGNGSEGDCIVLSGRRNSRNALDIVGWRSWDCR